MKKQRIIIINSACGSLSASDNDRALHLAALLGKEHSVNFITGDFDHVTKLHRAAPDEARDFQVTVLHEPGYLKNISLQRLYSHFILGRRIRAYLNAQEKPDVVFCEIPSLSPALAAAGYCRKTKTRFVLDILDLWPDAFKMVFHVPVLSDLALMPLRWMERRILRAADAVCAVSRTDVDHALAVNRRLRSGCSVFWGTSLRRFDRAAERYRVQDKPEGALWLGYCGSLGYSYDLPCVFEALQLLRQRGAVPPELIIMGDGPRQEELRRSAEAMEIPVRFVGRLPYDEMCGLLCACDLLVNPIVQGSAASVIRKHADYAAAGRPVLNTQESTEYRELVERYEMGLNCRPHDAKELADAMERLIRDAALRRQMGEQARRCAEDCFDRDRSYGELVRCVLGENDDGKP